MILVEIDKPGMYWFVEAKKGDRVLFSGLSDDLEELLGALAVEIEVRQNPENEKGDEM